MPKNIIAGCIIYGRCFLFSLIIATVISEGEIIAEQQSPTLPKTKASSKISPLITKKINKMQSLGINRENAKSRNPESISDPLVRVDNSGNIETYIYMKNMNQDNISKLESMNVKIENINAKFKVIHAWIPLDKVEEVASLDFVTKITPPSYGKLRKGSVTSEGDVVIGSDDVRDILDFDGTGTRVGVISDGVNSIASSQATGNLPNNIIIGSPGNGDEGTALLEIIHDIAPGAELAFSEGFTNSIQFVNSIDFLANDADVDIIVDDIGFLTEPYFQDGMVAQAVKDAIEQGVVYVSAAGNNADEHYQADYIDSIQGDDIDGNNPHDFGVVDGGQSDITMPVLVGGTSFAPNNFITVILQWSDPFDGSSNDYDLFLFDDEGNLLDSSVGPQAGSQDPVEVVTFVNASSNLKRVNILINRVSGSLKTLEMNFNGRIFVEDYNVPSDGVFGHPALEEVIAVGAVPATTDEFCSDASGPNEVEEFSSQGPSTIFFTPGGLSTFEQRPKPDVVATDGIHISGAGGFGIPDGEGGFFFCGTSASAPHVAGVAALILSKNKSLTPIQVGDAIKNTADSIQPNLVATLDERNLVEALAFSNISGFGRVDSFQAVQSVSSGPTPTPTSTPTPTPTPTNSGGNGNSSGGCSIGEKANVSQAFANLLALLLPIVLIKLKKIKPKARLTTKPEKTN